MYNIPNADTFFHIVFAAIDTDLIFMIGFYSRMKSDCTNRDIICKKIIFNTDIGFLLGWP